MDLTQFDIIPAAMRAYLRYNGVHFNKALCEFAVKKMKRKDASGKLSRVTAMTQAEVKAMLEENKVTIENDVLYDAVYVANMAAADFYGTAIEDKKHLALFVKAYLDDPDGYEGVAFNRFYADCARQGVPIPWEDVV